MHKNILIGIFAVVFLVGIGFFVFVFLQQQEAEPAPVVEQQDVEPKHQVIGSSVQGRQIESYTYGNGETHLVFVGGIHGGYEWNSVLLAWEFLDYLNTNSEIIPENVRVTIIPVANPDGLYTVVGKEGRFAIADIPQNRPNGLGRFNANNVDLNRNFDCKWEPESTWQGNQVSAGTAPFSEPEARAIQNFVLEQRPNVVVFWHSKANAVYASECEQGILAETLDIMNVYATAAEYQAIEKFNAYEITGDAEGWLASIGIPAVTVELETRESIEWERNLAGVEALFEYYSKK